MRPAEVVADSHQPHLRFQRGLPVHPGTAGAPHQQSQPGSKGGLQPPFDVSGVDDRFGAPLALHEPLSHRLLRAAPHHPADDLLHAPPRAARDLWPVCHHHPLGQEKSRATCVSSGA